MACMLNRENANPKWNGAWMQEIAYMEQPCMKDMMKIEGTMRQHKFGS